MPVLTGNTPTKKKSGQGVCGKTYSQIGSHWKWRDEKNELAEECWAEE
jgi:hypothetical protein